MGKEFLPSETTPKDVFKVTYYNLAWAQTPHMAYIRDQ